MPTRHASSLGQAQWQGCGHPDPGHGWDSGRAQLRGGFLDEESRQRRVRPLLLQPRRARLHPRGGAAVHALRPLLLLAALPDLAEPLLQVVGAVGRQDRTTPRRWRPAGNQWETIFDRALRQEPVGALLRVRPARSRPCGARAGCRWTNPVERFYSDCAAGTLPNISIVDPPFRDGGGGDGLSADEHPLGDVRLGQAFMSDVANAFVNSPNYRRGAMFIVYDEWGGFFDHVRPPRVIDGRMNREPRQGLRPDGLPHPGRGAVAVRAAARSDRTASASTTAPTATSRSSS